MTKLKAVSICKKFKNKEILNDVSISLKNDEIVSVLGESGSGKTTLFHIIAGLLMPGSGSVYLNNENITGKPGLISYMLQKDMLLPYKKLIDNVALPLIVKGASKKEAREKVAPYFKEFGIAGCEYQYPCQLSGGMRQRAAFLRTFIFSKEVALLDEPFSALDGITKETIHNWYLQVMDQIQLSTLFITHDIDEAILLSDRIYILSGKTGGISAEIQVTEPREMRGQFAMSSRFLEYKEHIKQKIRI